MSVPKQGGVLNYLGKQEIVKAPKHWQSSPTSPKTELVYITDAEKGLLVDANLHGSLLNKPNIGPSSLLSFDGWGDAGDFQDFGGGNNNNSGGNDNNDNWGGDQEDDVATMEANMNVTSPSGPTGWAGDSGVDAWESEHGSQLHGSDDYQGSLLSGTYATDKKLASRTISYGNDAPTEDKGRPDITYIDPGDNQRKAKYELSTIKRLQDRKLAKIKNKLKVAGFTDIPEDANFEQVKDYVTYLNRKGAIGDSWKNATKKDGTPLYSKETIEKWEKEGYVPQSQSMKHWALDIYGGAPLTYDQLQADFDYMEDVGKSGGGKMDWQERLKVYSPKQYEALTGTVYNPHTKTYTSRDKFGPGGNEDDRISRVSSPYEVGGTAPPQESQAAKWYASLGNTSSNTLSFQAQYNAAKTKQASILGKPSPMKYLAVSQSPFFDFLKENKLDKGIL